MGEEWGKRRQHFSHRTLTIQAKLATTEKKPSFAMKNPVYDGVCMGNR